MSVKVFDFFCGCGGASCGFRQAGMDIVYGLDCDKVSQSSFRRNFPAAAFESSDIRNVEAVSLRTLVNAHRPSPVLFCGCAPCQPFSKQNTVRPPRGKDERVPLLSHFARMVETCRPDIVFVENVPGIQKLGRKTQPFGGFLDRLESAGYHVTYEAVSLMKYGVPQSRCRLILLASLHGPMELPPKTNGPGTPCRRYETVHDWIGQLPPIAAGQTHPVVSNHRAAALSPRNLERIRATPEGGGHRDWPKRLRLKCHADTAGYSDVYGRMSWNRPASGLTTRCISYSNGRFGHPSQDRAISVREAACLQTFPADYVFEGSLNAMAKQIGNAVPTRLTERIGQHVIEHLEMAGVLN